MLTVMSWNMNQRVDAWAHLHELAERGNVDYALIQEAKGPGELPSGWSSYPGPGDTESWRISVPLQRLNAVGDRVETQRVWCSALVASEGRPITPRIPEPLHPGLDGAFHCSHPGQFSVGDIELSGGKRLTLISLYGIWDRMPDSGDLYPDATLHRAISDLTPIFQERAAEFVLVGGDLNLYSYSDGSVWGERSMIAFARLKAYGLEPVGPFRPEGDPRLERCPCPDVRCRHINTYLHQSNPKHKPYQLDFFFATPPLRERLVQCWADPDPEWYLYSDHRPILATFDA